MVDEQEKQQMKRERTLLERDIDQKILTYSKADFKPGEALDAEAGLPQSQALELDIQQLLDTLAQVNDSLQALESADSRSERQLNEHHREILREHQAYFKTTKTKLRQKYEKQELLQTCRRDIQEFKEQHGTTLLANERNAIGKVHGMADQIIHTAQMGREKLGQQRSMFDGIMDKTTTLISKFPLVNDIIQKIQRKKQRDMIVISILVAICLFLLWWFW
jgi:Golgi SNAP receptor complex protein 1